MARRTGRRASKRRAQGKRQEPKKDVEPANQSPGLKGKFSMEKINNSPVVKWIKQEKWTLLMLFGIIALAVAIRTIFFYEVAFSTWPPRLAGNDPMYHKWAIDTYQTTHRHFKLDPMLNYPLYGGNPRPPVYAWSVAIMGMVLSPLFGMDTTRSTWFVFEFAPSFWGAMTIIPIFLIGKEIFGKKEALLAALLFALSPAHLERSVLGFSDHDAIVVFFLCLSYYFMIKGLSYLKDSEWVKDWLKPGDIVIGFWNMFRENQISLAFFLLSGVSIGTIALTWKGFPYVLAIISIYYFVQIIIQKFRSVDSLSFFTAMFIVMATPMAMSLPYYYLFTITGWMTPFYIMMGVVVLGILFVPTRDIPWIIQIPAVAAVGGIAYGVLHFVSPETKDLLFSGGGYFVTNKLYSTIAEAQAPEISRMIVSIGPATFFAALVGIIWAAILIPKRLKKDFLFIVTWGGVAVFMAISAVRFEFNATPIFCILAGWIIMKAIKRFNPTGVSTTILSVVSVAVITLLLILNYYKVDEKVILDDYRFFDWIGMHDEFTMYIQVLILILVLTFTLGLFLFLKYFMKKEKYQIGTIIVALGVAFLVIMPSFFLAVDAGVPYDKKKEFDEDFKYFGSFGSSFTSEYWEEGMDWLADQDTNESYQDRPAWISWWDYGFWSIYLGQHPTVADNFQNGYQLAGSFIASQNETEAISLMVVRILEGEFFQHVREHGKGGFSDEVDEILYGHLDNGNTQKHPRTDALLDIYRYPGKYVDIVEAQPDIYGHYIDLKAPNAKYAAARVLLTDLGREGVVDLYSDLSHETGDVIQYFGVDSRLFPFSAQNTGIFYAPIKLADKDINDFIEYLAYCQRNEGTQEDPNWVDYPDNPLNSDRVEQEAEDLGADFRIKDYQIRYTDQFYNSMFYKNYIGYSAKDIGAPEEDQAVPSMFGEIAQYPAMQGWNMSHFKSVYRTMYYTEDDADNASFPDDYTAMNYNEAISKYRAKGGDVKSGLGQGVFVLKYYHGAMMNGTLRLPNGTPLANARIVVIDEYGIPHHTVITPEDGSYSLILPFGPCSIIVTPNELRDASQYLYDHIYGYQIDTETFRPLNPFNITNLQITEKQAMRESSDWQFERDMTVPASTVRGKIFIDHDNDGAYNSKFDELVDSAYLRLVQTDGDLVYRNTQGKNINTYVYTSDGPEKIVDENINAGEFFFKDIVPGSYKYQVSIDGHPIDVGSPFQVSPAQNLPDSNIVVMPSNLSGIIFSPNNTAAKGISLTLTDELTGEVMETESVNNGSYMFPNLLPGNYTLSLNEDNYFRESKRFVLKHGDVNHSVHFKLIPVATVRGGLSYKGLAIGELPTNDIVIEFRHLTNNSLTRYVFTDENGEYTVDLAKGEYHVYPKVVEGEYVFTELKNIKINTLDKIYTQDIELQRSVLVYGNITKVDDAPVFNTRVRFVSDEGRTAIATTNISGNYRVYLPYDKYTVYIEHVSPVGNNTFINQSNMDYSDSSKLSIRSDFFAERASLVTGYLYWDLDENGFYTSDILLDANHDFYHYVDDPGFEPTTADPSNPDQRPILFNTSNPLVSEGVPDIKLTFKSLNHTITTTTNSEGVFATHLPLGNFSITTNDPSLKDFTYWVHLTDPPSHMQDILENQRLEVEPKKVSANISLYSDFNANGKMDQGEHISYVPFDLNPIVEDREPESTTVDGNGYSSLQLEPTVFNLIIDHSREESGQKVDYTYDDLFYLDIGTNSRQVIPVAKDIHYSGQILYEDDQGTPQPAQNVTVTFIPIHSIGELKGRYIANTDDEGMFELPIREGDYTISIGTTIGEKEYAYQNRFIARPGNPLEPITITESIKVAGRVTDRESFTVDEVPIIVTNSVTNASVNVTPVDGNYDIFLLPDIVYSFEINYHEIEGEKDILYLFKANFTPSETNRIFDIKLTKYLSILFDVYFDENIDDINDVEERMPGIQINFKSNDSVVPLQYRDVILETNSTGQIKWFVPFGTYLVNALSDQYREDIRGPSALHVDSSSPSQEDINLIAKNVQLTGIVQRLSNPDISNSPMKPLSGATVYFEPLDNNNVHAQIESVRSGASGVYSVSLYPGEYLVYTHYDALGIYANVTTTKILPITETFDINMVRADRITGVVYFTDTKGALHDDFNISNGVEFSLNDAKVYADVTYGTYTIVLPEGDTRTYATYTNFEYGKDMRYSITTDLNVSQGHDDLMSYALQLKKENDYSLTLNFADDDDFRITTAPNTTVEYQLKVKNIGNVKSLLDWEATDIPDGWDVQFPKGEVEVGIEEEITVQVNVSVPDRPLSTNLLEIKVKTITGGGQATLKLGINTPKLFAFDFEIEGDLNNGVYFGAFEEYNLTIHNNGNNGDKYLIEMDTNINYNKWNVTLQGEEIPEKGYNLSIGEYESRSLTLITRAPNETVGNLNEKLELTFKVTSMFYEELETKTIKLTLQIRQTNLYVIKDSLKVENADLTDDKYEFVVKCKIKAENLEVSPDPSVPLVKLYWKDKELSSATVDMIKEDEIVDIDFLVNASDKDMINKSVRLKVVIDEENAIPEANENDNEATWKGDIGDTSWNVPWFAIGLAIVIVGAVVGFFLWWRQRSIYS